MGLQLGSRGAALDGVITTFDDDGLPDPSHLEDRLALTSPAAIKRGSARCPASLMIFDLLHLDRRDTVSLPYEDRRKLLAGLELSGDAWQAPSHHVGDGEALAKAARDRGLPGVVATQLDRPYRAGKKVRDWLQP
ncbi:MAG: hypothetical protein WBK99_05295 [Solirubrobacterales bacterium]